MPIDGVVSAALSALDAEDAPTITPTIVPNPLGHRAPYRQLRGECYLLRTCAPTGHRATSLLDVGGPCGNPSSSVGRASFW